MYDYKDVEKLAKNLLELEKDFHLNLGAVLMSEAKDCLEGIKKDSPVDTGQLRDSWGLENYNHKTKGVKSVSVEIFNPLFYSSYMEDGYYTTSRGVKARFVPGEFIGGKFRYNPTVKNKGMLLRRKFIEGRHMVRINTAKWDLKIGEALNAEISRLFKRNGV